jgi:membrane protease YdiL (CAAX protease family)
MSILKRILLGVSGLTYGILGTFWALLSIAFVVPDCTPASYEWDEYTGVSLPIGIISILVFTVTSVCILLAFRNKKFERGLFYILSAFGVTADVVALTIMRRYGI